MDVWQQAIWAVGLMARGPYVRIPNVGGAVSGADIANFSREVGAEPVDVDVVFDGAASAAVALHGGGRRYVGGIVIGVSFAHADNVAVVTPEQSDANGYDPALYVYVTANSAPAANSTVRVRMLF